MADKVIIDHNLLKKFMKDVFKKIGVPTDDAEIIADVLIASDLRGIESHGVQRLKMYYDRIKNNIQSPVTDITIVKETPTTARLDAGHGMGHVVAYRAMKMAIEKAKQYGTGAVAVGNSTHFGIAGYYPLMAAKEGMIGVTITNARPSVAPTFGVEPMMGTNPIAIAMPTDEEFPFIFDGATSIIQRGKIEVYARTNKELQEGWVIDDQGKLAIDSVEILKKLKEDKAALLPIGGMGEQTGGYKGYDLSVIVEILSAALWGGPFMKDLTLDKGYQLGHFFMAINVEAFIDKTIFENIAGNICRSLRNSKKIPGEERIWTAGEKEYYLELKHKKEGVPVSKSVLEDLLFLNKELGLNYNFK